MGNLLIILSFLVTSLVPNQTSFYNVDQMRRGTHAVVPGMIISTQGFYTPGDGGGANYYVDNSGAVEDSATIIKIGTGNLRARLMVPDELDIRKVGALAGGGKTDTQRRRNLKALEQAYSVASVVFLPADTVEIYIQRNDPIVLSKDFEIRGQGLAKSILSVHPKQKGYRGDLKLFDFQGGNLKVLKTGFYGYKNRWKYETYSAIIRPAGDADAIQLTGSQRAAFWTDLQNGDTMLVQINNATEGLIVVVTSFNSGTKIIQTNTTFATANDYQVASTYAARKWNTSATQSNINTYSQSWNSIDTEYLYLLYGDFVSVENRIIFSECNIVGFDVTIQLLACYTTLSIEKTQIQSNAIGVLWSGVDTLQPPVLQMIDSELYDTGTNIVASTFDIQNTNPTYGGGVYNAIGVQPYIVNCIFRDNSANAFRNFSTSDLNDKSARGWRGYFDHCTFYNNPEYNLIPSQGFPTYLNDCQFLSGGAVNIGNSFYATNCVFNVPIKTTASSKPLESIDSTRFRVVFDGCTFFENCYVHIDYGWDQNQLNKIDALFSGCTFYPGNNLVGEACLVLTNGFYNIVNSRVKMRRWIPYKYKVQNGTSLQPFIAIWAQTTEGKKDLKINIDNLQYDSLFAQSWATMSFDSLSKAVITVSNSSIYSVGTIGKNVPPIEWYNTKFNYLAPNAPQKIWTLANVSQKATYVPTWTYYNFPFFPINRVLNNILRLNWNGDTYLVENSPTIKAITIDQENTGWNLSNINRDFIIGNQHYYGTIKLHAVDTFKIVPFGIDTLSNILGNDTIIIPAGKTIELQNYAQRCLALGTTTVSADTIATANGTKTDFKRLSSGSGYVLDPFIPGSMTFTAGSINGNDDGFGNIVGNGISGTVVYLTQSYSIRFDTAPTAGTKVILSYDKYSNPIHPAYWTILNQ